MDRDEAITRIRTALKARTGRPWSVTGDRGTAWGWIRIDAPPARRTWRHFLPEGQPDRPENYRERDGYSGGHMSPYDRVRLAEALGLPEAVHCQGVSIPASTDYRVEYVDRAEGREPSVIATPYWD